MCHIWIHLLTYLHGFLKEPIIWPQNPRWLRSAILKIDMMSFFLLRVVRCYKILQTGAEWHVDCGDMVEIETRWRIPIWRMFGQIPCHVIPEPHITLQGAATWWIHCQDSRATCHIAGCSHVAKSMSWSCHNRGAIIQLPYWQSFFAIFYFFVFF